MTCIGKLLIVDDHPLYREGVVWALHGSALGAEVLCADSLDQALSVLALHPDAELAMVDLRLGADNGLAVLAAIGAAHPGIVRVLISAQWNAAVVEAAARAGAQGFVPKSHSAAELLAALSVLLDGGVYWPSPNAPRGEPTAHSGLTNSCGLTSRQLEVLQLVDRGLSNAAIGAQLGVTERTVKAHLQTVFEQLAVHSRVQALIRARELGLLQQHELHRP